MFPSHYSVTELPGHKHCTLFFLLGVPLSHLYTAVAFFFFFFAKPFFHWPALVAKRFIKPSQSIYHMLFSLHHTLCSLILCGVCVYVCVPLSLNFADSDSCNICICKGTLWWAISGLLFPQCSSVENISMHQCFPCFFTLHICNPESPFALSFFLAFFFSPFSPLSSRLLSFLHANERYLVALCNPTSLSLHLFNTLF